MQTDSDFAYAVPQDQWAKDVSQGHGFSSAADGSPNIRFPQTRQLADRRKRSVTSLPGPLSPTRSMPGFSAL